MRRRRGPPQAGARPPARAPAGCACDGATRRTHPTPRPCRGTGRNAPRLPRGVDTEERRHTPPAARGGGPPRRTAFRLVIRPGPVFRLRPQFRRCPARRTAMRAVWPARR
eukprot:scaffold7703_cov103-Isochrysis_galbana.AAC.4